MAAIYVLIGIGIGRGWRWIVDLIPLRQRALGDEPNRRLVYYLALAMVSGMIFSLLPFGPAPSSLPRSEFHAGLIVGFIAFWPFAEAPDRRRERAILQRLGSSILMLVVLTGGYLLGSDGRLPP